MKCQDCKYWNQEEDSDGHACYRMREEVDKSSGLIWFDMGYQFQEVYTKPDFGCVLFGAKL